MSTDIWKAIMHRLADGFSPVYVSDNVWPRVQIIGRDKNGEPVGEIPGRLQAGARERGLVITCADAKNARYEVERLTL